MKNKNSILLLVKNLDIQRNISNTPFSGLSWEDTEKLLFSILQDTVSSLSDISDTDILLFINKSNMNNHDLTELSQRAKIIETNELQQKEMFRYALNYVSITGYRRNVIQMVHYPICDLNFYKNIFYWLSDEHDYVFIAPARDLTLGMVAFKDTTIAMFNQLIKENTEEIEAVISNIIPYDLFLITPMSLPSIMYVSDIIELKDLIEKLIRSRSNYPITTYNLLKYFEKKYVIKNNHENGNIRRYF